MEEKNRIIINWNINYNLAKKYFEHNGNLCIPTLFKTINGYEYDENGVSLGNWIRTQRKYFKSHKLSKEKINLLNNIGMIWNRSVDFDYAYECLANFHNRYGCNKVPVDFKTYDGITYDKDGFGLGAFVYKMKHLYNESRLTSYQIEKLEKIDFDFVLHSVKRINKSKISRNLPNIEKEFELIKRYKNGEKNAFEDIVNAYYGLIIYTASCFNDENEFDDLVQVGYETLRKIIDIYEFKGTRFFAYFSRVMYRDMVKYLDSIENKTIILNMESDQNECIQNIENSIYKDELKSIFENILIELNDKEREIIKLKYGFYGKCYTYEEIGLLYGITRSRIFNIEKRLLIRIRALYCSYNVLIKRKKVNY